MSRTATRERKTRETEIRARIDLDGTGEAKVHTGIGFFDHMLDALARHGMFDLDVECAATCTSTRTTRWKTWGSCWADACSTRWATSAASRAMPTPPCRWTRRWCAPWWTSAGGRSCTIHVPLPAGQPRVGEFDASLSAEFWRAFATEARVTLHLDGLRGDNAHHVIEATFKAAARALDAATAIDPRRGDVVPSTKGAL